MVSEPSNSFPSVELYVFNYNGGELLLQTLESVLSQDYINKKVILSDNESSDDSVDRAQEKFRNQNLEVRLRNPGTGGCYSHSNVCIAECKSPYIAFLHGDDLYPSHTVSKQIEFLENNPDVDVVLTAGWAIDEKNERLWPIRLPDSLTGPILTFEDIFKYTLKHGSSIFICPSALFRTSVFSRVGLFADLPYCGDMEMWLRILEKGKLAYLNEPLINYRIVFGQGTSRYERNRIDQSEFFLMLDSYLERHSVDSETRADFEALKKLDLFAAGLNRLILQADSRLLNEVLDWFAQAENQKRLKNFGTVDRLKLNFAQWLRPLLISNQKSAPFFGKLLLEFTDPRAMAPLRWAMGTYRKIKAVDWREKHS